MCPKEERAMGNESFSPPPFRKKNHTSMKSMLSLTMIDWDSLWRRPDGVEMVVRDQRTHSMAFVRGEKKKKKRGKKGQ